MHAGVKRNTKRTGDLSELRLMHDLVRAGYVVSIPFGEDHRYDLLIDKDGIISRKLRWASRYLLFSGTAPVGKAAVDAVTARALQMPL